MTSPDVVVVRTDALTHFKTQMYKDTRSYSLNMGTGRGLKCVVWQSSKECAVMHVYL